ncbi:hypothetical protein HRbin02_00888 [Candidatus Calditenuaceae archaeon HR02]|nr:hypothetical protein HRbin02_00888 [Candidatus Calditenuaceae archaeon HR02]
MVTLPQSELTISLVGAISGLLYGFIGLGWSSLAFKTLLITGVGPRQGYSISLLSDVLLEVGGKIFPIGKSWEKCSAKDATFSGLKLLNTLLVSAASIGSLETRYEKHLIVALNLILALFLATRWNAGKGDASPPSHSSSCVALYRSGWLLNLYPSVIQRSRTLQLLTTSLPKILVIGLFVPLHEADALYILLLTAPAQCTLCIARRVRGKISEEILERMAVIAFALRGLVSLIS